MNPGRRRAGNCSRHHHLMRLWYAQLQREGQIICVEIFQAQHILIVEATSKIAHLLHTDFGYVLKS